MQIGLGIAAASVVVLWALGERPEVSRLAVPVLLLGGAAMVSVPLAWSAGMPPSSPSNSLHWRYLLAPLVVALALEAGGDDADPDAPRRRALLMLLVWSSAALIPALFAWVQVRTGIDPMHALGFRRIPLPPPHRIPFAPGAPERFAVIGFFSWYTQLAHAHAGRCACRTLAALALSPGARACSRVVAVASAAAVPSPARSAWPGSWSPPRLSPPRWRRVACAVSRSRPGSPPRRSITLPAAWERLGRPARDGWQRRATIWHVCFDVIRITR
jgi:hypothetical protein